MGIEFITVIT